MLALTVNRPGAAPAANMSSTFSSPPQPTVLVVGAAGRFAGLVVPELARRGASVRALIRHEPQAASVRARGAAQIGLGDLRDLRSLDAALDGVDGVFHIGPAFAPDEAELGLNMVAAARRAGVRRFVFSSVIQPTDVALANHASKIPVEQALFASGMAFTILHPANFFQNLTGAFAGIVNSGRFAEPFPATTPIARVDYRDVAEVAALALTGDALAYGSFELCADGAATRQDIAGWIAEATGRPIEAAEARFADWSAQARTPYDPAQLAMLEKVHEHYAAQGLRGNSLTLRALLGRAPRSLRDYIHELAATAAATARTSS
jgi:uncharacterized protein YbjT (DUF2867 family)